MNTFDTEIEYFSFISARKLWHAWYAMS